MIYEHKLFLKYIMLAVSVIGYTKQNQWHLGLFSDRDVVLLLLINVIVPSPFASCDFVGFVSPLPVKFPEKSIQNYIICLGSFNSVEEVLY